MAKTLLFTGFRSSHDLRFFEKCVNTSVFLRSSRQTIGSNSVKNAVIYRGLAPSRAKNCVNTSVSASKSCQNTAIYTQCFVPSTLSWYCKNIVNTSIFCDQPAKKWCNLQCFFAWLSKTLVFAVFRASLVQKSIGIYSIFCVFALLPQKTFVNFEKLKIVRKMCQNGTFFRF